MADPTHPDSATADSSVPAASNAPANAPANAGPADAPTSDQVRMALRKVKDPELNLNIIDLGLVYEIAVDGGDVDIDMTLTSPGCPAGPQIMGDVERAVKAMAGVKDVNINLVWEPFWSPEKIEPRVRAYMGL